MTDEPTCHFCPRPAVHIIQGRHVCDDQYCKYNAWQLEPKEQ